MLTVRVGAKIGRWILKSEIARGGNSVVWLAEDAARETVAIKVLNTRDPSSVAYRRFQDEVHILRELGDRDGILPLLDAATPANPSRSDAAWIAMPTATPLHEALSGHALEDTAAALSVVAEVLADLAADGVHHRDLKPQNLYWSKGGPAVGDFGLVDFPGKEEFTDDARQVGPAHYIAPEMRDDPVHAGAGPADVYSLAKTLWVIASGQRWPPLGQHRLDEASACLRSWVDHPRVAELDRLIERATATDPSLRPTMREFAAELSAWRRVKERQHEKPDLSEFAGRVGTAHELAARRSQRQQIDIQAAENAMEMFVERMQPVGAALREIGASEGVASVVPSSAAEYLGVPTAGRRYWTTRAHPVGGLPWLWVLFGIALYEDGTVVAYSGEVLGLPGDTIRSLRSDLSRPVPVGSALVSDLLDELSGRAISELPRAMSAYADALGL